MPGTTSAAAEEGTVAHALAEAKLKLHFGLFKDNVGLAEIKGDLEEAMGNAYYNSEMEDHVNAYVEHCIETYAEASRHCERPLVFVEQKLDLTKYAPESFGTADFVVVADHALYMRDLKYGKGVAVSAENNTQLKIYGLGAYEYFGFLYEIDKVNVGIFQPRIQNIAQFEITVGDLLYWADEVLRPRAELAFAGEGNYVAGKHCKFCKVSGQCRAYAEMNGMAIYDDFTPPKELSDEEIIRIVEKADDVRTWLKSVEEWVLSSALGGKRWPNWKLVEGKSNRKYADEVKVVEALKSAGYSEEDIFNKAVKGISVLEKEIGKKNVAEILEGLVVKPKGAPTLAPVSDKRQEWSSVEADFNAE